MSICRVLYLKLTFMELKLRYPLRNFPSTIKTKKKTIRLMIKLEKMEINLLKGGEEK